MKRASGVVLLGLLLVLALAVWYRPAPTVNAGQPASAFPAQEAGITAYVHLTQTITLSNIASAFRTIEFQNDDLIVGSVAVPDYDASYDVHVYVQRDGWMLAYYPSGVRVSKTIDWVNRRMIPTNLERVLTKVASKDSLTLPPVSYYHFDYPGATQMHLIKKTYGTFKIKIPSSFEVYNRTWEFAADGFAGRATYTLDGVVLADFYAMVGPECRRGTLSTTQLAPDIMHAFQVTASYADAISVLALIYQEPAHPAWIYLESAEQSEIIPLARPGLVPTPIPVYLPMVRK